MNNESNKSDGRRYDGDKVFGSKMPPASDQTGFDDDEVYITRPKNKASKQHVRSESQPSRQTPSRPDRPASGGGGKKRRKRRRWPFVLLTLFLIALVLAGVFVFAWNGSFFRDKTDTGSGLATDIGTTEQDNTVMNILFLGIDNDEGRTENFMTDTILVCSLDFKRGDVAALQIPRDTYVGTDLTSTGKINALYSSQKGYDGQTGIAALSQFIYDKMNIPIDHYATITMRGMRKAIDGIGGVAMDVPYAVSLDGVELEPGTHTLDGNQAEKLVRQRYGDGYRNGDVDRLRIQRLFMASLVQQMLGTPKSELAGMVMNLTGEFTTDMQVNQLVDLASRVSGMDAQKIGFYMEPGENAKVDTDAHGEQDVYSVHRDVFADLINQHMRPDLPDITGDDIGLEEISNEADYFDNAGGTVNDITSAGRETMGDTISSGQDDETEGGSE